MPRISKPTVAEHRAARERALLDAAHAVLLETGEAPGLAQVAARAGLARTSVYQYYRSKAQLLQAMVRDIFPRWTERDGKVLFPACRKLIFGLLPIFMAIISLPGGLTVSFTL